MNRIWIRRLSHRKRECLYQLSVEWLKKAEEMGYIKITVEYPVLSNEELSASLKKKYNLEKVFLVPKLSDAPVAVQEDVCRAAAKDLSFLFK